MTLRRLQSNSNTKCGVDRREESECNGRLLGIDGEKKEIRDRLSSSGHGLGFCPSLKHE